MTTTEKTCFKCGVTKLLTEFYAHKRMADGHLNKCKCCTKADERARRYGPDRDRILAKDRARGFRGPADLSRRYKLQHPERRAAQIKLGNAIRDGRMGAWPACAQPGCDCTTVEAHHPDYSRPLDVVWLCPAHHKQAHALARHFHDHQYPDKDKSWTNPLNANTRAAPQKSGSTSSSTA